MKRGNYNNYHIHLIKLKEVNKMKKFTGVKFKGKKKYKFKIVDPLLIPDEYKKVVINEKKVNAILKAHGHELQIPGTIDENIE